jgi:hypothetical protein
MPALITQRKLSYKVKSYCKLTSIEKSTHENPAAGVIFLSLVRENHIPEVANIRQKNAVCNRFEKNVQNLHNEQITQRRGGRKRARFLRNCNNFAICVLLPGVRVFFYKMPFLVK